MDFQCRADSPERILELLAYGVRRGASDLHLSAGVAPLLRVDGEMRPIDAPPLEPGDLRLAIRGILNDRQSEELEALLETDFSFEAHDIGRFRVNVFMQGRGPAAVFRVIPSKVPTMAGLGLGPGFERLCLNPRGLVLVTGPTGSGKSTTLAAMIDFINGNRAGHILTIEDPVEFIHPGKRCLVNQREVHRDTLSFSRALRSALREDPDVIMVGELRDLETIRLALTAAETGHLVLGTLHTVSAVKTVDRVVDVFPAEEKAAVRAMLSESLRAVISQALLKRIGGGRIAAHEIMLGTPAIRNLIREGKVAQMVSAMQTGGATGMQTLDSCLRRLVDEGIVDVQTARAQAHRPDAL